MNRRIKKITVEYYLGDEDVFTNDNNTQTQHPFNPFKVPKGYVIGDFFVNYVPGKTIHIKSSSEEESASKGEPDA